MTYFLKWEKDAFEKIRAQKWGEGGNNDSGGSCRCR